MLDGVFLGAPRNARIVVVGVCLQTDHIRPLIAVNKELNVQFVSATAWRSSPKP